MRSISTRDIEPAESRPGRAEGELRNGYRPRLTTLERSREIRETAARFIASQGLWRFSMLALARHLNCLLPTLCYYYKKREELIADIAFRHIDHLRIRTDLAMAEVTDEKPDAAVNAFAREYLLAALAEPDFHRLMLRYPGLAGPDGGRTFVAYHEALRAGLEQRLMACAPGLAGQPGTANALSHAMLDMLDGASAWMRPYGLVKPVTYAAMIAAWVLQQAR